MSDILVPMAFFIGVCVGGIGGVIGGTSMANHIWSTECIKGGIYRSDGSIYECRLIVLPRAK